MTLEAGTQRATQYTNLSPGEYAFRVKAANPDGVWSQKKALQITILPPWWRTWWAFTLYSLLFSCGVFVVDRFQRRRLVQRERERARERELEQAREIERWRRLPVRPSIHSNFSPRSARSQTLLSPVRRS